MQSDQEVAVRTTEITLQSEVSLRVTFGFSKLWHLE